MWGATALSEYTDKSGKKFQFTHPMWGATAGRASTLTGLRCFNSRTPCGVRRSGSSGSCRTMAVSIHAPHVGCDKTARWCYWRFAVSIHAPHVGCDRTPPCRLSIRSNSFNSRTPCGVRQTMRVIRVWIAMVSIHAPHVGCDCDAQRYALVED